MSHQVVWTKRTEDFFGEMANLTKMEREILHCRIMGMTRVETIFYLDDYKLCMSTLDKIIARLKVKYDAVQQEYPDMLNPRKDSAAETYMDTH